MHVKALFDDDEAVSPVIGVILMVAITVILAAVIATFVLGLGDQISNTAPQASFSFDYSENDTADTLQVTHNGGETISANEAVGTVSGAQNASGTSLTYDGGLFETANYSDVNAGTTDMITESDFSGGAGNGELDLSGATVRVTYQPAEGGNSATLGRWDGPDA